MTNNEKANAIRELSLRIMAVVHPDRPVITNDDHQIMKDAHDEIYRLEQLLFQKRKHGPSLVTELAIAEAKIEAIKINRDARIWYANESPEFTNYSARKRHELINDEHMQASMKIATVVANLELLR